MSIVRPFVVCDYFALRNFILKLPINYTLPTTTTIQLFSVL